MDLRGIINKTSELMNEAGIDDAPGLLSEDTIELPRYIQSVIPDAINIIARVAPLEYLNAVDCKVEISHEEGYSVIELPKDFSRLSSLKLAGWKRCVHSIYPLGSEMYAIQHNEYTTAGVNKPVCVFASHNALECFPKGKLIHFFYVKTAVDANSIDILREDVHIALCYMCASLVYEIFENANTSDRLKSVALNLLK